VEEPRVVGTVIPKRSVSLFRKTIGSRREIRSGREVLDSAGGTLVAMFRIGKQFRQKRPMSLVEFLDRLQAEKRRASASLTNPALVQGGRQ
jgi:hypothetical protein